MTSEKLPKTLTIRHITLVRDPEFDKSDLVVWRLPTSTLDISISRHSDTWWSMRVGRVLCKCASQATALDTLYKTLSLLRAGLPKVIEMVRTDIEEEETETRPTPIAGILH